jgi:hypothetical protein
MPVPGGNELIYLPLMRSRVDPTYLVGDWTFGSGFGEHAVFNLVFGPLVNLMGIEWLAGVGRFVSWFAIGWVVVSLGRRLGARWWACTLATVTFIGLNQSMGVGAEFLFSGFEAKSVAWPLLLAALVAAIDQRYWLVCVLVGLTFSFHPAIGLWGGGALLLSLLALKSTRAHTIRLLPLSALAALPGLIPLWSDFRDSSMDSESAAFIVLSRIPHHADPSAFGERGPIILALMLGFNLLWSWIHRSSFPARLLGTFEVALTAVFISGVVAWFFDWWEFLLLLPFRVMPIFVHLLFWLIIAGTLTGGPDRRTWLRKTGLPERRSVASTGAIAAAGLSLIAVVALWNPVVRVVNAVLDFPGGYTRDQAEFQPAMEWIAQNTEPTAVVATSPWVDEMFYMTERPQFVSWGAVTYDRPQEWRTRLERTVTDANVFTDPNTTDEAEVEAFEAVSAEEWRRTSSEFGVDYLLTTAELELESVYSDGNWTVYSFPPS